MKKILSLLVTCLLLFISFSDLALANSKIDDFYNVLTTKVNAWDKDAIEFKSKFDLLSEEKKEILIDFLSDPTKVEKMISDTLKSKKKLNVNEIGVISKKTSSIQPTQYNSHFARPSYYGYRNYHVYETIDYEFYGVPLVKLVFEMSYGVDWWRITSVNWWNAYVARNFIITSDVFFESQRSYTDWRRAYHNAVLRYTVLYRWFNATFRSTSFRLEWDTNWRSYLDVRDNWYF